jgi:hypothetical protein
VIRFSATSHIVSQHILRRHPWWNASSLDLSASFSAQLSLPQSLLYSQQSLDRACDGYRSVSFCCRVIACSWSRIAFRYEPLSLTLVCCWLALMSSVTLRALLQMDLFASAVFCHSFTFTVSNSCSTHET